MGWQLTVDLIHLSSSLVQPFRPILQSFCLSIKPQNQLRIDEDVDEPRNDTTKHFLRFVLCLSAWIDAEDLPPVTPKQEAREGGDVPRYAVILAVQGSDSYKCGALAEEAWFAHGRWEMDGCYQDVMTLSRCLISQRRAALVD